MTQWTRVSTDALRTGVNTKMLTNAAARLNVDVQLVIDATDAVMMILTTAAQLHTSDAEFETFVLGECEGNKTLASCLSQASIRGHLWQSAKQAIQPLIPVYSDCRWRADVLVARRACREQCEPSLHFSLMLQGGVSIQELDLNCDVVTCRHIIEELESALAQSRSHNYAKVRSAAAQIRS